MTHLTSNPQQRAGYQLIDSHSRGMEPIVDWASVDSIRRWLVWNDPNGDYGDDSEYGPLTLEDARDHMIRQTEDN